MAHGGSANWEHESDRRTIVSYVRRVSSLFSPSHPSGRQVFGEQRFLAAGHRFDELFFDCAFRHPQLRRNFLVGIPVHSPHGKDSPGAVREGGQRLLKRSDQLLVMRLGIDRSRVGGNLFGFFKRRLPLPAEFLFSKMKFINFSGLSNSK